MTVQVGAPSHVLFDPVTAVHVGLALVVLQVWRRGGLRWLGLAILLHFSINAVTALLALELQLSPWLGELVLVAMAAAVLTLGLRLATVERQS
jgi:hypothetical protein